MCANQCAMQDSQGLSIRAPRLRDATVRVRVGNPIRVRVRVRVGNRWLRWAS